MVKGSIAKLAELQESMRCTRQWCNKTRVVFKPISHKTIAWNFLEVSVEIVNFQDYM